MAKFEENRDLIILTGAGASFAQQKISSPPLGKNLADEIRKVDPRFNFIERYIGIECGEDFEDWLVKISDEVGAFTLSLAVVASFFRKYRNVKSNSLYFDLISSLGKKGISRSTFISLNYESLLEMALRDSGYRLYWGSRSHLADTFNSFSYKYKDIIPFYKPHGSAHFLTCMMADTQPAEVGFVYLDLASKSEMLTKIVDPVTCRANNKSLSVISAYEPKKRNPFNNSFINDIRKQTLSAVKKARLAIVIGIRYSPRDAFMPRVFRSLCTKDARIEYVGSKKDYRGYSKAYSSNKVKVNHLSEKFDSNCINEIQRLVDII